MTFAIFDSERPVFINFVNETIGIIYAPRPMSSKFVLEKFGLADTFIDPVAFDVLNQIVNALERLAVLRLPIDVLLKSLFREGFVH